jgi:hypothetical protein
VELKSIPRVDSKIACLVSNGDRSPRGKALPLPLPVPSDRFCTRLRLQITGNGQWHSVGLHWRGCCLIKEPASALDSGGLRSSGGGGGTGVLFGCAENSLPLLPEPNISFGVSGTFLSGDPAPRNIHAAATKELPIGLEVRPWSWDCSVPRPPKIFRTVFQCSNWASTGRSRGKRDLATTNSGLVGSPKRHSEALG